MVVKILQFKILLCISYRWLLFRTILLFAPLPRRSYLLPGAFRTYGVHPPASTIPALPTQSLHHSHQMELITLFGLPTNLNALKPAVFLFPFIQFLKSTLVPIPPFVLT